MDFAELLPFAVYILAVIASAVWIKIKTPPRQSPVPGRRRTPEGAPLPDALRTGRGRLEDAGRPGPDSGPLPGEVLPHAAGDGTSAHRSELEVQGEPELARGGTGSAREEAEPAWEGPELAWEGEGPPPTRVALGAEASIASSAFVSDAPNAAPGPAAEGAPPAVPEQRGAAATRLDVRRLLEREGFSKAIVLAELIGPPRALRPYRPPLLPNDAERR